MEQYIVYYLALNLILGFVVAYVAEQKGRSGINFFFLTFFLSFLVGVLVILALPPKSIDVRVAKDQIVRRRNGTFAKCPYCDELISCEAKVCRFCSREVERHLQELVRAFDERSRLQELARNHALEVHRATSLAKRAAFKASWKYKTLIAMVAIFVLVGSVFAVISVINKHNRALYLAGFIKTPSSPTLLASTWHDTVAECGGDKPGITSEGVWDAGGGVNGWRLYVNELRTGLTISGGFTAFQDCISLAITGRSVAELRKDAGSDLELALGKGFYVEFEDFGSGDYEYSYHK